MCWVFVELGVGEFDFCSAGEFAGERAFFHAVEEAADDHFFDFVEVLDAFCGVNKDVTVGFNGPNVAGIFSGPTVVAEDFGSGFFV